MYLRKRRGITEVDDMREKSKTSTGTKKIWVNKITRVWVTLLNELTKTHNNPSGFYIFE